MTKDEIIDQAEMCFIQSKNQIEFIELFAKAIASAEREACAYRAGIALLGADRGLSNRVDQAIRARGNT